MRKRKSSGQKFGEKWKLCVKCGEYKLRDGDFHFKAGAKDGLQAYCKICLNENSKRDYKDNVRKDLFADRVQLLVKSVCCLPQQLKQKMDVAVVVRKTHVV